MASALASQNNAFQRYSLVKRAPSKCSKVYMISTTFKEPDSPVVLKPLGFPHKARSKANHPLAQEKIEIFNSLEGWARDNVLPHLKQVEKCWQPQDFLPDAASDDFHDKIKEIKERAEQLPDDYFVVLVGDMITEEALPTYQTFLNTKDGIRDETGSSLSPWAIWTRAWTAEENRHGDLLNKYLYLTGQVDMKQIEKSIQYLIGSGMDVHTENNPYLGFIYTSFQERATFISHGNTARLAKYHGDDNLTKICGTIASDEKRHEIAYTKIMEKLFKIDPDGSVKAFSYMMQKKITMPAHWLYDGQDENLYTHFSAVALRLGVYTGKDYADILEDLVKKWNVRNLVGLSSEGRKAQEYVCELGSRFRKLEERAVLKTNNTKHGPSVPFRWIFNRPVKL